MLYDILFFSIFFKLNEHFQFLLKNLQNDFHFSFSINSFIFLRHLYNYTPTFFYKILKKENLFSLKVKYHNNSLISKILMELCYQIIIKI